MTQMQPTVKPTSINFLDVSSLPLVRAFEGLAVAEPHHADVIAALKLLGMSGDDDVLALTALLTTDAPAHDWNRDVASQFMKLRQSDTPPVQILATIVGAFCAKAQFPETHVLAPALSVAVVLGSVPSSLPFHSHHHTRDVVSLAGALLLTQHRLTPMADLHTTLAEMLIAACIHDFVHDGQGNRRAGRHNPMRLERRALEKAEPYLQAVNIPDASWQRIRAMVLATDVSKDGSYAISPSEWIRHALADETKFGGCPADLLALFNDKQLLLQAALLEDADLSTSAGMPYEYASRMTALVSEETKVLRPTPATLIGFIDHICRGRHITQAAHTLFGDNMAQLRLKADRENADTFYSWS